jgi:hypothetical protein
MTFGRQKRIAVGFVNQCGDRCQAGKTCYEVQCVFVRFFLAIRLFVLQLV